MTVGHPADLAGAAGPVAELVLGVVGERADHGDALARGRVTGAGDRFGRRRVERQSAVVASAGQRPRERASRFTRLVILGADDGLDALLVRQTRVLEQAEAELEREDAREQCVCVLVCDWM